MAFRLWHGALLSSHLKLLLAVMLVTALECKPLSKSLISLNRHSLVAPWTHEQEQETPETEREEAPTVTTAAGEQREVGREEEFADAEEFLPDLNRASAMAAATRPTIKSWPDLIGLDVEEAKKKILEEHPNMLVQILPEGSMMTMDFNLRRVRIHKTKEQKVAQIPRQG